MSNTAFILDQGVIVADGLEMAVVGVADCDGEFRVIYDEDACIEILITRDGMTREEAMEFFAFNVQPASPPGSGPLFLSRVTPQELLDASKGE